MGGVIKGAAALGDREVGLIGDVMEKAMADAGGALSTLLGKDVFFVAGDSALVGESPVLERPGDRVAASLAISGGVEGSLVLVCDNASAAVLVDLLMGGDGSRTDQQIKPEEVDALGEIVNQAAGAAVNGLASKYGVQARHAVQRVFSVGPDSVDALNDGLDYPVVKLDWTLQIGDSLHAAFQQIVERRLALAIAEAAAARSEPAEGAKSRTSPAAAGGRAQGAAAPIDASIFLGGPQPAEGGDGSGSRSGAGGPVTVRLHQFPEVEGSAPPQEPRKIDMLLDVPLNLTVELGRTRRLVKDILQLGPGSVIELDKLAGEAVDVLVNGRLLAKAEVVVIDENFGVRITEIVGRAERLKDIRQQG